MTENRIQEDIMSCTPVKSLKSKLDYARSCVARIRSLAWRQDRKMKNIETTDVGCSGICREFSMLSKEKQDFIRTQITCEKYSKFGIRWPKEQKLLSLGIFYKSPSAYRFVHCNCFNNSIIKRRCQ